MTPRGQFDRYLAGEPIYLFVDGREMAKRDSLSYFCGEKKISESIEVSFDHILKYPTISKV